MNNKVIILLLVSAMLALLGYFAGCYNQQMLVWFELAAVVCIVTALNLSFRKLS